MLLTIFSQTLCAATLEIPLFANNNGELVSLEMINTHLGLSGEHKFLEKLIVENNPISIKTAHEAYWDLFKRTEELEIPVALDIPGQNRDRNHRTCYRGMPSEAVEIVASLGDSVYSDQLGIWGWKYKKEIHLIDAKSSTFLDQHSSTWKNWKVNDETILILSHQNDEASDINEGIIRACSRK
jgi:hypothetical protein